jgi:hypothetical protein
MDILTRGLATSPAAMQELRDGLLNDMAVYASDQDIPEGAFVWMDRVAERAASEVLPDVALMVDGAMARQNARTSDDR